MHGRSGRKTLWTALHLAVAVLVLLGLHLIHGCTLLFTLFVHCAATLQPGSTRLRAASLDEDIARWRETRLPRNVAVVFVPAARGRIRWKFLHWTYEPWPNDVVLHGMQADAIELVQWCFQMGIESLSLYDEEGIMKRHNDKIFAALVASPSESPQCSRVSSNAMKAYGMRITLLSKDDGKHHLSTVARGLAKATWAGILTRDCIDIDYAQRKVLDTLCPEPDLMIVLGGLHLRLRGFSPWHARLCEIYHDASLGLLGPPRLRYRAFRRAMDAHAACQQRYGR